MERLCAFETWNSLLLTPFSPLWHNAQHRMRRNQHVFMLRVNKSSSPPSPVSYPTLLIHLAVEMQKGERDYSWFILRLFVTALME
jgi:hypothetical protein